MTHPKPTPLEEAERQLKMNLSLIEMLKKNTTDEQIANLRRLWVQPWEDRLCDLKAIGACPGDSSQPRTP